MIDHSSTSCDYETDAVSPRFPTDPEPTADMRVSSAVSGFATDHKSMLPAQPMQMQSFLADRMI
jgi:hypothetical protein